jgi:hypothetical protein
LQPRQRPPRSLRDLNLIMTFVVNRQVIVFQKGPGPRTDAIATSLKAYVPDKALISFPRQPI